MNRHICQLELQEGCARGHVCELPAQPRGLAANPLAADARDQGGLATAVPRWKTRHFSRAPGC